MKQLLLLLALAGCAHAPPTDTLDETSFLEGTWIHIDGETRTDETWTAPAAGTMFGVSRTTKGGKLLFFEYLRIEKRDDKLVYLASPKGRDPPTPFEMVEASDDRVVFENADHDDPQRVIYWFEEGRLHARVERMDGSKRRTWVYEPYP